MTTDDPGSSAITVDAPAKINLALHVCGRWPDGFHLLDSLVVFTDAGDRITASQSDKLQLNITGPFGRVLSNESNNLVLRAARFLQEATKSRAGANITLEKNLPIASGIGGGSSDAAATLRACAALWSIDLAQISNVELSNVLGADIPVCVFRKPAFMAGIGEAISRAPQLPESWLVLVNPGQSLETKRVFSALKEFSQPLDRAAFAGLARTSELSAALKQHANDLMDPAVKLVPAISSAITALEREPGCLLARLSGSGPTCFGVFDTETAARDAAARIGALEPNWWVKPTKILAE